MTEAPDFARLADGVTGGWPQVVALWEEFRARYGLRLPADRGDTDRRGFLTEALGVAYARKRLGTLSADLEERGLVTPAFLKEVAPHVGIGMALQSSVNAAWRVQYAKVGMSRIRRAYENVCRISIGSEHRGTGVLVRPNLVVTAAHVVEPLVDAAGKATKDSLGKLEVLFAASGEDESDDPPSPPVVARLDHDWLAHYSGPASNEHRGEAITSIAGIAAAGPWDVAAIRLSRPPVEGLNGYTLHGATPNPPSFGVHVLHHPADPFGAPMELLWSIGQIRQALGGPQPLRWLHDANTNGGSSGAPCFDNDWKLVALHQAGPNRLTDPDQINRAVPIHGWINGLAQWAARTAPVPYPETVTDLAGQSTPLIGRRELQTALWTAMSGVDPAAQRAFVAAGDTRPGGQLTVGIVVALAKLAGRKAVIDIRNALGDDALGFARRIVGALAAEIAVEALAPSRLTSALRDLRNDLVPALLAEIAAIAAGRQVWLVLHGFEAAAFPGTSAVPQIVELAMARLDAAPGLHLLLAGWTGPPGTHFLEPPTDPQPGDIVDYVLTALSPGGELPAPKLMQTVEDLVALRLARSPEADPYARAVAVAEKVREAVGG